MKTSNKIVIYILNIAVPLLTGCIFYFFTSPKVLFVRVCREYLHLPVYTLGIDNLMFRLIRCYLLDFLWGYSFVFALFVISGEKAASKKLLLVAIISSIILEGLQFMPLVYGTFDIVDIFVEILAELIAFKILCLEGNENEKH